MLLDSVYNSCIRQHYSRSKTRTNRKHLLLHCNPPPHPFFQKLLDKALLRCGMKLNFFDGRTATIFLIGICKQHKRYLEKMARLFGSRNNRNEMVMRYIFNAFSVLAGIGQQGGDSGMDGPREERDGNKLYDKLLTGKVYPVPPFS